MHWPKRLPPSGNSQSCGGAAPRTAAVRHLECNIAAAHRARARALPWPGPPLYGQGKGRGPYMAWVPGPKWPQNLITILHTLSRKSKDRCEPLGELVYIKPYTTHTCSDFVDTCLNYTFHGHIIEPHCLVVNAHFGAPQWSLYN